MRFQAFFRRHWIWFLLAYVFLLLVLYKNQGPNHAAARGALAARYVFLDVTLFPAGFWECGPAAWGYVYFVAKAIDGSTRDGVVCQYPRGRQDVVFFSN